MEAINEADIIERECEEFFGKDFVEDFPEKDKSRFNRRKTDAKKSIRKKKLDETIFYHFANWEPRPLHAYSKNKIHCSCPICSAKTNNRGRNKYYGAGSKNWKHSDRQKIESLEQKEKEPE